MTHPVSREEFLMLRDNVQGNERRLDEIDRGGTRGVGILAVQVAEVIKDVAGMRDELDKHRAEHREAERERQKSRRWAMGTVIALVAALEGPLVWIITHLH